MENEDQTVAQENLGMNDEQVETSEVGNEDGQVDIVLRIVVVFDILWLVLIGGVWDG